MNKNFCMRLLSMILIVFLTFTYVPQANISATTEGKIAESLLEEFDEQEKTTFLVYFDEAVEVEKVAQKAVQSVRLSTTTPEATKEIRQKAVISSLKQTSEDAQQEVMAYLEEAKEKGHVDTYKAHYIVNIIVVTGTKEVAENLAKYKEVNKVLPNEKVQLHQTDHSAVKAQVDSIEWNIDRVNAPEVWEQGITGEGIVIATIDSGVEWNHPALKLSYRGYDTKTGEINHDFSWYDAAYADSEKDASLIPIDRNGHGTHVTGTMVGYDSDEYGHIGIAPGAKWIAVNAFDFGGGAWDHSLIAAAEWILNPTSPDGEERPDLAPDIVNNSWGKSNVNDIFYREIVRSWIAAGIFPVFAAGNGLEESDVIPGSVEVPANYPESFAVGSIDNKDQLAKLSLLGPSPYDEIKPDVVAPGVEIISSIPFKPGENKYGVMSGTSMAAPVVAGTVALLMQAAPELTVNELKEVLKSSATPLTDKIYTQAPNNGFGYGLVNAALALEKVQEQPIERIEGSNRFLTAIEISKDGWDSADTVILTRNDEFADALAVSPLAYKLDAPILLTKTNSIYAETLDEIKRLGAKNIILLGEEKAIHNRVQKDLEAESLNVRRIGGRNRTETAAQIAKEVVPNGSDRVFIVNGYDFPDALSVSSYAAIEGIPILLTQSNKIPPATTKAITDLKVQNTLIVGGPLVVNEGLLRSLPSPDRISGTNRYKTNTELAEYFDIDYEHMYIATGLDYADVLTGSVLTAKQNTGILLVHRIIPENLKAFLQENGTSNLTIFGGPVAVSLEIEAELLDLLQ